MKEAAPAVPVRPRRRPALDTTRPAQPRAPHLRPYQVEAQQSILEHRARGVRTQLVSLATGLGKTVIIATLPKLLSLRPGDVTLVVAHRDELIEQIVDKMRVENPEAIIGIEKAERRAGDECNIVVATVQTLAEKRLEEFVRRFHRRISLFVIDEAHHAAAPTYRAIVDAVLAQRPEAMVLGFTATPNRGDGVRLVDVFEKIVYTMDARKGIDAGYLVP
ncbi:MAG: ATP-dependent helicase, partial [Candidatus Eremiobacteraeota bacterium]|nr:ATP-dependent helicase [Candidatus Eremiobacteraeota bacterium]